MQTGFLGLGAMGTPMARTLLAAGFRVTGYDADPARLAALVPQGLVAAASAASAARGADVLIVMVQNFAQASAALLGDAGDATNAGAFAALPDDATVLVTSTLAPVQARELAAHLHRMGRGLMLVDAPVSGGPGGAAAGKLTLAVSGDPTAVARVQPLLDALGPTQYHVGEAVGAALTLKAVNQLLAGIHIAAAAEAIALAQGAGLDTATVMDYLAQSAGYSWMLGDRGPRMIAGAYTPPKSALAIFVKDLGIVRDLAAATGLTVPLVETALAQFQAAADRGFAGADDSAVIEVVRAEAPASPDVTQR